MSNEKEIAELVSARRQLDERFKQKEMELDEFRQKFYQQAREIETRLANICEHIYTRDSYAYAPLYCRHCLLEKEQVWRLKARSQN